MKYRFSKNTDIKPSATVALNSMVADLKRSGKQIYNLGIGEAQVAPHSQIVTAVENAIETGKTLYPPVKGYPELLDLACVWHQENYESNYTRENTIITPGGKAAISMALQSFLDPGDEVIIFSPHWVSYPEMVKLCGAKPVIIKTDPKSNWSIDFDSLEAKTTNKAKMLIINNCANPTGKIYSPAELLKIAEHAKKHDLIVISDEVYSSLTYSDSEYLSLSSFDDIRERLIIIQSFSKHFALTGLRVGIAFADPLVIKRMELIQNQSTSGTASLSQFAAIAALKNAKTIQDTIRQTLLDRMNLLVSLLNKAFDANISKAEGGLYLFVPVKTFTNKELSDLQFCEFALNAANVALVAGSAFGQENYVRLSFGVSEFEIESAVNSLATAIKKHE
ncbi:MAG: aminotransferase class I/II-fold pyridoxal phosphate-dependent enzyme [Candidatus Dojkabacteria bacterium]|uniref:Aminotransferase n=2 Tax=Candidatus Dojkabacteria TaxID=74243 RepID=A0A136KJA6_9BACT|nr:MAG: Aspartate aminotransferase [candidate division WS6 bacterium OLB21]MBW7953903.1 aminotransferase class I/II-fold pyridoxal phosphate-dependent enzyme [Candidatus Dojkabacteria bacterium]WKZ28259.1 MAG: aminotransferase class I/II-fold pyridoxal phosphate-dependent enzyme [Candidatus Dojkabacteria bacterium]